MSTTTANNTNDYGSILLDFCHEATRALESCQIQDPMTVAECRRFLLEQQQWCLEKVVGQHNHNYNHTLGSTSSGAGTTTTTPTSSPQQNEKGVVDIEAVQEALAHLSTSSSNTGSTDTQQHQQRLNIAMEEMNDTARVTFARLVLWSECQRSSITSLNNVDVDTSRIPTTTRAVEQLKTSRMTRSELLEFCGLCRAAIRIEGLVEHIRAVDSSQQPLLLPLLVGGKQQQLERNNNNNSTTQQQPTAASSSSSSPPPQPPPMKRLENLQRLLFQAMGYDADLGLQELARQAQITEGNDDVELVNVIRQTTKLMMETVLGYHSFNNNNNNHQTPSAEEPKLLSDRHQGGVTRVVSVQHSETIVLVGGGGNGSTEDDEDGDNGNGSTNRAPTTAPVSQSMRGQDNNNSQWQMARDAAALRESLVRELQQLSDEDRAELLQTAQTALRDFQTAALSIPAGPDRIEFLRSMPARTQKLLAMHRIWMEEMMMMPEQQQQRSSQQGHDMT